MAAATGLVTALGLLLPVAGPAGSAAAGLAPTTAAADPRPNIVLVVMDDFSMDLLSTMRHAREMRRTGAHYSHSYVVDSMCCPSRASLLTGQYPHQTGVLVNVNGPAPDTDPMGGFAAFKAYGNFKRSVNVRLKAAGYTTGFVGKFLNGYSGQERPPGWSSWRAILASAYDGWGYRSTIVRHGAVRLTKHPAPRESASDDKKDRAYVGQVAGQMALRFIRSHRDDRAPYFLEVAPYAAHSRIGPGVYSGDPMFPPAFQDRSGPGQCGVRSCRELDARDLPGFGDPQDDNAPRYASGDPAPEWRKESTSPTATDLTRNLRDRARMAQTIDRMLGRILASVDRNTYVLLTSDNGFHLGQHGLGRGKGTPFASDVQVPLLVVGPGVKSGARGEVVSNVDLAPTFEDLAGLTRAPYRSGRSLVPTFRNPGLNRRTTTFIEHVRAPVKGADPDAPFDSAIKQIPSYTAVRTRGALLVRFDLDPTPDGIDHAWEFYDYSHVGWEETNVYGRPEYAAEVARLSSKLEQFDACSTFVHGDVVPRECRSITQ
jgi:N-acetylglucosamine-6-sulfatase